MSERQSKISDKQHGNTTPNSERSGSSFSANTPILDSTASPIPISNAVFYCNESGSTTPESEVESSLAYKGTRRYSSEGRRNRKLEKKKDDSKSENNDITDDNENNGVPDVTDKEKHKAVTVGILEEDDAELHNTTVDSKSVQTDLLWHQVENLFENIDNIGLDGMKQLLLRLQQELCGRKQAIPGVYHNCIYFVCAYICVLLYIF